jgi:outer membrane protein assembly factor BamB
MMFESSVKVQCCGQQMPFWLIWLTFVFPISVLHALPQDRPDANSAANWQQFRGPNSDSISSDPLPRTFGKGDGIAWGSELQGRGSSSPIVCNGKVFLTSSSGYGQSAQQPGKRSELLHWVACHDLETGKELWSRSIAGTPLVQALNENLLRHGFASSTPVTDGEMLYVSFGASGVFAFDLEGELVWQADIGYSQHNFGSSASLMLCGDRLVINASIENDIIYALDKKTGSAVWKIDQVISSWAMPVVGKTEAGDEELVVSQLRQVRGFDPQTGKQLWRCDGVKNYVVATPLIHDGVVYCNGGLTKQTMAIKLGGRGDVTQTHKLWEVPKGANVSAPVIHDGHMFLILDNGILQVFDIKDGRMVKRHRLPTKSRMYSSPVLADGLLYINLEDAGLYVCEANVEATKVAHVKFAPKGTSLKASVVPVGDRFLIRSDSHLYLFAGGDQETKQVRSDGSQRQSKVVVPPERYEFPADAKWARTFTRYLSRNHIPCQNTILAPYKSVITDAQRTEAIKIIEADYDAFYKLRQRQRNAHWKYLKGGSQDHDTYRDRLVEIDADTCKHADKIRVEIKKLFSEDQMEAHLKEAAERQAKARATAAE